MGVESSYYQTLITTPSLTAVLGDRIYPVRIPQDKAFPNMLYDVEVEIQGRLSIDDVEGLFSFSNTFYCKSYGDIIAITEAFRDISKANQWNIAGYVDLDYVTDKDVYARTIIINILGQI